MMKNKTTLLFFIKTKSESTFKPQPNSKADNPLKLRRFNANLVLALFYDDFDSLTCWSLFISILWFILPLRSACLFLCKASSFLLFLNSIWFLGFELWDYSVPLRSAYTYEPVLVFTCIWWHKGSTFFRFFFLFKESFFVWNLQPEPSWHELGLLHAAFYLSLVNGFCEFYWFHH